MRHDKQKFVYVLKVDNGVEFGKVTHEECNVFATFDRVMVDWWFATNGYMQSGSMSNCWWKGSSCGWFERVDFGEAPTNE